MSAGAALRPYGLPFPLVRARYASWCSELAAQLLPEEHRVKFLAMPLRAQLVGVGFFAVLGEDQAVRDLAMEALAVLDQHEPAEPIVFAVYDEGPAGEDGKRPWIQTCHTTIPALVDANAGDEFVKLDLAPSLVVLEVGGEHVANLGAGGCTRFVRVK